MGASGSKKHSRPSRGLRERLLRACGGSYVQQYSASGGGYSRFQEESGRGQKSPSCEGQRYQQGEFMNIPWRTPASEGQKDLSRFQ
uniref:Nef protein n=1 Tax=Human immunodeficiency virus 2 TaxID=11709 RepID=O57057_9HIV2|nr:nef protein [Human immunodeficiency virus 2]